MKNRTLKRMENNMKRFFSFVLALAMVIMLVPFNEVKAYADVVTDQKAVEYGLSSYLIELTTPDLGGKIVKMKAYHTPEEELFYDSAKTEPIEYELICDGRTYKVLSCKYSDKVYPRISGYSGFNYSISSDDPSIVLNEQWTYMCINRTLRCSTNTDKYHTFINPADNTQTYTISVVVDKIKEVSIPLTKFKNMTCQDDFVNLEVTKSYSDLDISDNNGVVEIISMPSSCYYNDGISDSCFTLSATSNENEITIKGSLTGYTTSLTKYGWNANVMHVAYQPKDDQESTYTFTLQPGTSRSVYLGDTGEIKSISVSDNGSYTTKDSTTTVGPHVHSWDYTVDSEDSAKLIASCSCEQNLTLTLSASSPTASGNASTITIGTAEERQAWEDAELTIPTDITYYDADHKELDAAPTKAGTYTAAITAGTATAEVSYTIDKLEPSCEAPSANNLVYTGEKQELITAGTTEDGTIKYSLSEDGTYSENVPKAAEAGEYKVYYKLNGDSEHFDKTYNPVTVTIAKADSEDKEVSQDILAGSASSGTIQLPEIPDHMTYGAPVSGNDEISGLKITDGTMAYSASSDIQDGSDYTIQIPVTGETGANYKDFNINVKLTGKNCTHVWNDGVIASEPTLKTEGSKVYTCTICQATKTEPIAKLKAAGKLQKVSGLVYNGKKQTGVKTATGYTLTGNIATNAGKYTATATLKSGYVWSDGTTGTKTVTWSISKAKQNVKISVASKTVQKAIIKKKAFVVKKPIKVTGAKGKVTYTKYNAKSYAYTITKVDKKNGNITMIKHPCEKVTKSHTIKVKVNVAATKNYAAYEKTVKVTIKMK